MKLTACTHRTRVVSVFAQPGFLGSVSLCFVITNSKYGKEYLKSKIEGMGFVLPNYIDSVHICLTDHCLFLWETIYTNKETHLFAFVMYRVIMLIRMSP